MTTFDIKNKKDKNNKIFLWGIYSLSIIIIMIGLAYASVPLYRLFCQTTGFGGTVQLDKVPEVPNVQTSDTNQKIITVQFNSDISDDLPWSFKPMQNEIKVKVGETALAFYNAHNYGKESVIGISTYNVTPQKVGLYFNKIQCFCFEEQMLKPGEEIEMPILFYLDPEILDDSRMLEIDNITLSYTFFKVDS